MATNSNSRSPIEHSQHEQRRTDIEQRTEQISRLIDRCSRALGRGGDPHEPGGEDYYHFVARACREGVGETPALAQLLREHGGRDDLMAYSADLRGHEWWDGVALDRFLGGHPPGFEGRDPDGRRLVTAAFRSLAAIAEVEDLVADELQNKADAVGFAIKLGDHLQQWGMDLGDPVQAVTEQAGALKTLFFGPTGQGKSTGLEREAEDYYQQHFREGQDFKLIDPIGLRDGENWYYDVPQQQQSLRRIREEMDLPPDFAAGEAYGRPQLEILVPLTPGLAEQRLPYHVEGEQLVVRPYVAPASALSESLLVSLLVAETSDQEQNTIRQAYRDVDRHREDWALRDLAGAIEQRDELQAKTKRNAIGVLRNLQSVGFIRTGDSAYTIDWRDLFMDTGTITVFSQAFLDRDLSRLIAVAHIVETILDEREQLYGVPEAVLLMRELWKVAPHKGRQHNDDVLATIQQVIGTRLTTIQRENRHYGLHLLADTQWPSDCHISVRKNFNRYVSYGGNRNIVGNVFDWTANAKSESFYRTLSAERGVAGVVGQVQPAIDEQEIEFLSPIRYAPPSHHHKDKDTDDNGWLARAKYFTPVTECENDLCGSEDLYRPEGRPFVLCTDCYHVTEDLSLGRTEELRRPVDVDGANWPDEIPPGLSIGPTTQSRDDDVEDDPQTAPVATFVHRCLQPSSEWLHKSEVKAAFNAFLEEHDKEPWDFDDRGKQTRFGNRVHEAADWPIETGNRKAQKAYLDTAFTEAGKGYLDQATGPATQATAEAD